MSYRSCLSGSDVKGWKPAIAALAMLGWRLGREMGSEGVGGGGAAVVVVPSSGGVGIPPEEDGASRDLEKAWRRSRSFADR